MSSNQSGQQGTRSNQDPMSSQGQQSKMVQDQSRQAGMSDMKNEKSKEQPSSKDQNRMGGQSNQPSSSSQNR